MTTRTVTGMVARREAVKCQVLWTLSRLLPKSEHRKRRIIAAAFDQGVFGSLDVCGRDQNEGLPLALLSLSLDADRYREHLLLHPSIRLPKHWVDGVVPELRTIVECFAELVTLCRLSVSGLIRLKKNAPRLELDGEPVSQPFSTLKNGWVVAASGPLAHLDELSVFYALSSDLSEES